MDLNFFNSWQSGKLYYLVLWSAALVIISVMLLFGFNDIVISRSIFKNKNFGSAEVSNQTINELLLSADELNIGEKNSFINLYLKPEDNIPALTAENNQTELASVYNKILNRKIKNLDMKIKSEDFSVKPIPK